MPHLLRGEFAASVVAASVAIVVVLGLWHLGSHALHKGSPSPASSRERYYIHRDTIAADAYLHGHRVVALDSSATGHRIASIGVLNGVVLVASPGALHMVDPRTARVTSAFSDDRREAATMLSPFSMYVDPNAGTVWVYTFHTGEITRFRPAGSPAALDRITIEPGRFDPQWTGETIVAGGGASDSILRWYHLPDHTLTAERNVDTTLFTRRATLAGVSGPPLFSGLPPDVAIHLNQSHLALSPKRRLLVAAFRHVDRLHIYSGDGRVERTLASPIPTQLNFSVDESESSDPRFLRLPSTALVYVSVTANDHLIFALYSGHTFGTGFQTRGRQLHVFTWDGRLVGVWGLQPSVEKIAVEPSGEWLYGLDTTDLSVYQFALTSIAPQISGSRTFVGPPADAADER